MVIASRFCKDCCAAAEVFGRNARKGCFQIKDFYFSAPSLSRYIYTMNTV